MSHTTSLRVLLVEDSSLLASRIAELISRLPAIEVIAIVATQTDAVSSIARDKPDVIILDLHLRSGSGFGVLRSMIRSNLLRRPRVIVLTNFGLPEYRREAEHLGVDAFLDKSREFFRIATLLTDFAKERHTQALE